MKTLTAILLSIFLFGCVKEQVFDIKSDTKRRDKNKVSITAFGWMANYNLKYKRASGWVDTVITQQNYTVQYECYNSELQLPVTVSTIERYDKDTLRLSVTINQTLNQQAIINKCDAQVALQPNQAL